MVAKKRNENLEENLVKVKREDVKNPRKREENHVKADVAVKEDDKYIINS